MHKPTGNAKEALMRQPREKLYCVTTRLISPEGTVSGTEVNVWRHTLAEAENVYRSTPTLALLVGAGTSHDWDEVREMTAEKELTAHVFNAIGEEITKHSGAFMRESKTWQDLEDLILGKGDDGE